MEKFIDADTIRNILTYNDLIPLMEKALCKFSSQCVVQPVRSVLPVEKEGGFLGLMPALCEEEDVLATKLVTFFPHNLTRHKVPTHNAVIVVFCTKTGIPRAIMDGEVITSMRTAAVSAVATKYLAPAKPQKLAILGAGVQARSHFRALSNLFHFKEVYIWSRTFASAEKCAKEIEATACTACNTVQEAVKDADVIVTVTAAVTPVLKADWVKPGAHINGLCITLNGCSWISGSLEVFMWNVIQGLGTAIRCDTELQINLQAVGACRPEWSEIDSELMCSSVLYVDSREGALTESGDVILSKAEIFAELGEMILGQKPALSDKTTVFKSLGMAIEDSMSAKLVMDLLNSNKS